ncbi:hypothetical protein MMC17_007742 [Xylographa soralifera]|nr:hypothetical protein [Xylographa soralifera]
MSKVKGIGGLAIATFFGILNGVAIFGPALKDQELQKLEHTSRTDEATQDVDQISGAESVTSSSDISSPAGPGSDSALPTISSNWSIPKLQDWKAFWMEGDRASKEKITNTMVTKSVTSSDKTSRTTENVVIVSNSPNP